MANVPNVNLIDVRHERWALAKPFVISRGSKTCADVVVATVSDGDFMGRGEAVPYKRYGESVESVLNQVRSYTGTLDVSELNRKMAAGAARNVLDCALWDLLQKRARLAGVNVLFDGFSEVETAITISLGSPHDMAEAAAAAKSFHLLKLKLDGPGDEERMLMVRQARPDARLIGDANEAWRPDTLETLLGIAAAKGFELIEQPLPAADDHLLERIARPIVVCADESVHTSADIGDLKNRYDAVNIKLDKAGGLTEAFKLRDAARDAGLRVMVGSMVATSLGVAPALSLCDGADWVDLDGPLLLAEDRAHGLHIKDGVIGAPTPALWG